MKVVGDVALYTQELVVACYSVPSCKIMLIVVVVSFVDDEQLVAWVVVDDWDGDID